MSNEPQYSDEMEMLDKCWTHAAIHKLEYRSHPRHEFCLNSNEICTPVRHGESTRCLHVLIRKK